MSKTKEKHESKGTTGTTRCNVLTVRCNLLYPYGFIQGYNKGTTGYNRGGKIGAATG